MAVAIYPVVTMKNALASFINLLTLLIGIAIGIILAPHLERPARASQVPVPQGSAVQEAPASTAGTSAPISTGSPEQIQPTFTAGSEGIYLVLAHHIQADELVVNGIDLMKLQEGELELLSKSLGVTQQDIQRIVAQSRNTHLYQVATPKMSAPAQPPNPKK